MSDEEKQKKEAQWLLFVDRMMDTVDVIATKFTSGKFLFTLATAGVFVYAVVSKLLTAEQVMAIIMLVVGFYFNREEIKNGDKPTEVK